MAAAAPPSAGAGLLVSGGFRVNTTSLQTALQQNTLGVGFSGSGFLILFFTGVTAILKQVGVINSSTKLAGASGGAVAAASACSGLSTALEYQTNVNTAVRCRSTGACRGFLDSVVRQDLASAMPPDGAQRCRGRLFAAVTQARPGNATDVSLLLGPQWASNAQVINAAAVSSFLPAQSGPLVTDALAADGITAAYDGGFGWALPTPPGVTYAITVSVDAPKPSATPASDPNAELLQQLVASADATAKQAAAAYLPLNPVPVASTPQPDIFPGLSGALKVPAAQWQSWGLNIPDNATLEYIFNQGRADAAAFVGARKLANAAAVQAALEATTVKALTAALAQAGSGGSSSSSSSVSTAAAASSQQRQPSKSLGVLSGVMEQVYAGKLAVHKQAAVQLSVRG